MTAADLAAVVVSVLSLGTVAVLTWAAVQLRRTTAALADALTEVRDQALPALAEARAGVNEARLETERVIEIIDAAEAVSSRIDSASRVAYLALSKPVIKGAAVASGTKRAAKRLREG